MHTELMSPAGYRFEGYSGCWKLSRVLFPRQHFKFSLARLWFLLDYLFPSIVLQVLNDLGRL